MLPWSTRRFLLQPHDHHNHHVAVKMQCGDMAKASGAKCHAWPFPVYSFQSLPLFSTLCTVQQGKQRIHSSWFSFRTAWYWRHTNSSWLYIFILPQKDPVYTGIQPSQSWLLEVTVNTYSLQSFFTLQQLLFILKTDMARTGEKFTLQINAYSSVAHNIPNVISSLETETFVLAPKSRFIRV